MWWVEWLELWQPGARYATHESWQCALSDEFDAHICNCCYGVDAISAVTVIYMFVQNGLGSS